MPPRIARSIWALVVLSTACDSGPIVVSNPADDVDHQGPDTAVADALETALQLAAIESLRFDVEALAEVSFREYWGDASEAQRAEAVDVLGQILENTVIANRRRRRRSIEHVETVDIENGRGVRVVERMEASATEQTREVLFALHVVEGEWRIFDVRPATSGALSGFYYEVFGAPGRHESIEGVIQALRRRLAEGYRVVPHTEPRE